MVGVIVIVFMSNARLEHALEQALAGFFAPEPDHVCVEFHISLALFTLPVADDRKRQRANI